MSFFFHKLLAIFFTITVLVSQQASRTNQQTAPFSQTPPTGESLESTIDAWMQAFLEQRQVAGGAVSVVQNDQVILVKGYGLADVEKSIPVNPGTTLFRLGEVSGLITATAVMQMVEAGRLDLDADVNSYLDFRVPPRNSLWISTRQLLTHTAGFEEKTFGVYAKSAAAYLPLGSYINQELPTRVRTPGVISAYSVQGTALAGYIVQRVASSSIETVIKDRIFIPLEMQRTTAEQPIPSNLADGMSGGYQVVGEQFVRKDFEFVQPGPGAGISSSALDMAKFMLAHLARGRAGDRQILLAATADQMHKRAFSNDDNVNGMTLGFMELNRNGLRVIGQKGNTRYFHSMVFLLPDQQTGVFVAFNTDTAAGMPEEFFRNFMDFFYPARNPPTAAPETFEQLGRYTGAYRLSRSANTTPEKILDLVNRVELQGLPDGTLLLTTPEGKATFRRSGPLTYRQVDGSDILVFEQSTNGAIQNAYLDSRPDVAFEKLPWWFSPRIHLILLAVSAVLAVSVILATFLGVFVSTNIREINSLARRGRQVLALAAALTLITMGMYYWAWKNLSLVQDGLTLLPDILPWFTSALVILAVIAIFFVVSALRYGMWNMVTRLHYTFAAASLVVFLLLMIYYNQVNLPI